MMLWLSLLCASPDPTAAGVAIVIPPTERGREFASQLAGELDEAATVRTSSIAFGDLLRSLTQPLLAAADHESRAAPDLTLPRLPWPESYLVCADPELARVLVIRPRDRTLLLRALDPSAARASPYALAVAAAELLRTARATEAIAAAPRSLALGGSVALGVSVVEAFGHEPVLAEGVVEADLEILELERKLWSTVGVSFGATGSTEVSKADTTVRYRRWDPSLRLGFGSSIGDLDLGVTFAAGVSIARAEAFAAGERIAREDRVPVRFALGGRARYHLAGGFGLQLSAALSWLASPADYVVRDEVAISEGRFRWQVGAAALWRWR